MFADALREIAYRAYRGRLALLLQIPTDTSDQQIHKMIEAGFSACNVQTLCDLGTLSPLDREWIIPLKTFKMRLVRGQRLTMEESERLFRFAHITALAETLFEDKAKAKRWLSGPKVRFSAKNPIAMISTIQGTQEVEEVLIQAFEGTH